MRRFLFSLALALLLLPVGMGPVASVQGAFAVSSSPFADLGLPELTITVSAIGYEGIPESTPAGRYLVTVTADDDVQGNYDASVVLVQDPDTVPGAERHDNPPTSILQWNMAGGAAARPGQSAQVVLDLTPGVWVALGFIPSGQQTPFVFEATGDMPTELPEPIADVTLTLAEYTITVSDGQFTPGPKVVRVDNTGAQLHFVFGMHTSEGVTEADVEAWVQAEMTGTPVATGLDLETNRSDLFVSGWQSPGTTQWVTAPIVPAGAMVLVCLFPDASDGLPHALHGEYAILDVAS
jgi:hypothetical protein